MNDITDLLAATADTDGDALARLRAGLATRAAAQDLLDVAFTTVDSPSVRCCWPRPSAAYSVWRTPARITTPYWRRWRTR